MGKPKNHDHIIKGNGKGKTEVICSESPPCKAQRTTQKWVDNGAKEDRSKGGFRRSN